MTRTQSWRRPVVRPRRIMLAAALGVLFGVVLPAVVALPVAIPMAVAMSALCDIAIRRRWR